MADHRPHATPTAGRHSAAVVAASNQSRLTAHPHPPYAALGRLPLRIPRCSCQTRHSASIHRLQRCRVHRWRGSQRHFLRQGAASYSTWRPHSRQGAASSVPRATGRGFRGSKHTTTTAACHRLSPYRRQRRALPPTPHWSPSAPSDHVRSARACRHRVAHGREATSVRSAVSAEQRRVVLQPCASLVVMPSCVVGQRRAHVTAVGGIPKTGRGRTSGATGRNNERAYPDWSFPPLKCPYSQFALDCGKPFRLSAGRWNSTNSVSQ